MEEKNRRRKSKAEVTKDCMSPHSLPLHFLGASFIYEGSARKVYEAEHEIVERRFIGLLEVSILSVGEF